MNELAIIFDRLGIPTREVLRAAATKWNFLPFSSGQFVASKSVALARLFPIYGPGARSDDDGSLTTRRAAFLSGTLLDCGVTPAVAGQPRAGHPVGV